MAHPPTAAGAVHLEVVPARAARTTPARSLRRFAGWLSALLAEEYDGVSARFAVERRRDGASSVVSSASVAGTSISASAEERPEPHGFAGRRFGILKPFCGWSEGQSCGILEQRQ